MWIALAIGAWAAGSVALEAPPGALGERVLLRLLDEGYTVVPRGHPAAQTLIVGEAAGRLFARARGEREDARELDAEPRAVAELELLQRAIIALDRAGARTVTSTAPVVRLVADALDPKMRGRLAWDVLGAGFGVTRTSTGATFALCALSSTTAAFARDPERCDGQRIELAAVTPAVIRALFANAPVEKPPAPARIEVAAPARESAMELAISASGGALARSSSFDPVLGIGASLSRGSWGARFDAAMILAGNDAASVVELAFGAGPELQLARGSWWSIAAAVELGVLAHHYDVDGSTGTHFDFAAVAPLAFEARPTEGARVRLELEPGLSARPRTHLRGEDVLWERGAPRLAIRLAIAWESVGRGNSGSPRE